MGCRSCGGSQIPSPSTIITAEQTILRDQKPVAEPDGSLLFDRIAPTMVGYVHDRANPNRLKPDLVPCTERITLPVLGRSGVWVMNQCNHLECPKRGQTVDEEICSECPFRKERAAKTRLGEK